MNETIPELKQIADSGRQYGLARSQMNILIRLNQCKGEQQVTRRFEPVDWPTQEREI